MHKVLHFSLYTFAEQPVVAELTPSDSGLINLSDRSSKFMELKGTAEDIYESELFYKHITGDKDITLIFQDESDMDDDDCALGMIRFTEFNVPE